LILPYEDPFATAPTNDQFATDTKETAPVTETTTSVAASPNPFKIGFTLKAAAGFDAEWLTPAVYGTTAEETAQRGKDLLLSMQEVGLIDMFAKAANYTRSTYIAPQKAEPQGKPSFQNGQVQYQGGGQGGGEPARPDNVPAHFSFKSGTSKAGKAYKGWFPPRGSDEKPIFVN
jgi:hypothetical protein